MHRLTVIGAGYLGAVHAACLAELGFEVLGMDIDPVLVATLNQGQAPFCEPGLDPMLRRGLRSGRLRFTVSLPEAARFGDVHFLCVGTPQRNGHPGADLSQLYACVDALAPLLRRPCLVAGKSTTPVGIVLDHHASNAVTAAADNAMSQGYLLQADHDALIQAAQASNVLQ